jgi:hypothetical protein
VSSRQRDFFLLSVEKRTPEKSLHQSDEGQVISAKSLELIAEKRRGAI